MEDKSNKVLYICRANVGRSQVAAALHNHYAPETAESAGVDIGEVKADTLDEWDGANVVIDVMRDRGFDIAKNHRHQIEREEALKFGTLIVMAEVETRPLYLLGFNNAEIWDVEDLKDKNRTQAEEIVDDIDQRVQRLILRLGDCASCMPPLPAS